MSTLRRTKRETALVKDFYESYEKCEAKNRLCISYNCECGRKQRHKWLENQILTHFEPDIYYTLTICPEWDICDLYDLIEFNETSSAKYLSKRLRSLKIPGFKGAFFLDVEKEDRIKDGVLMASNWHVHWYGLVKADVDRATLQKLIKAGFQKKRGFQPTKLKPVIKKPYNCTYPLKLVTEHKAQTSLIPYGRIKSRKHVTGEWLEVLQDFYANRSIENCMFFIGFRRNGNTLVPIKDLNNKYTAVKRKMFYFSRHKSVPNLR